MLICVKWIPFDDVFLQPKEFRMTAQTDRINQIASLTQNETTYTPEQLHIQCSWEQVLWFVARVISYYFKNFIEPFFGIYPVNLAVCEEGILTAM